MVDAFQDTFAQQEEARTHNLERMKGIERGVRELEAASWDREGAVEKFGV
jgi:hypothetical protein